MNFRYQPQKNIQLKPLKSLVGGLWLMGPVINPYLVRYKLVYGIK